MIKFKFIVGTGILLLSTRVVLACSMNTDGGDLGTISSFNVPNLSEQQISGGLSCNVVLDLLSPRYIKYMPVSVPTKLKHTNGINEVGIEIKDVNNNIVSTGVERNLSDFTVLSLLFGGPNKSVPFKVKVQSTIGLKPGIYSANMDINWFYHVNAVGLLGVGIITYDSPDFELNLLGLLGVANWGTGRPVTIPLKLTVQEDCIISTNNINFGSAAFTSQFNPVTGAVHIKCSAQTPYNVGLSDGKYFNTTRRLKHSSQDTYIGYEVYKNSTNNRWGSLNTERWNSEAATTNPSNYDAVIQQSYSFTSKILNPSNTVFPEGVYTDILQVDVQF